MRARTVTRTRHRLLDDAVEDTARRELRTRVIAGVARVVQNEPKPTKTKPKPTALRARKRAPFPATSFVERLKKNDEETKKY
jgi:hypothetical protein